MNVVNMQERCERTLDIFFKEYQLLASTQCECPKKNCLIRIGDGAGTSLDEKIDISAQFIQVSMYDYWYTSNGYFYRNAEVFLFL